MKKAKHGGDPPILIHPAPGGWRTGAPNGSGGGEETEEMPTPPASGRGAVVLALPASEVMIERLTLPSQDREELSGMVRLQLEKTLPYPPEEITCGYELIRGEGEDESVVLAAAVHNPALDALCQPMRAAGRLPTRVSIYAAHIAAACPEGVTLVLYREQAQLMLAICENRKPSYVQSIEYDQVTESELERVLLMAEMEGIPTAFDTVLIDPACGELREKARQILDAPIETLSMANIPMEAGPNLVPPQWEEARRRLRGRARWRSRLIAAAVVYAVLVVAAIGYVILLKQRAASLDRQLAEKRPLLVDLEAQQSLWETLAPAVVPSRYAVEVLFQVTQGLPSGVNVTEFDMTLDQFRVEGEASAAALAIQYAEALKQNEALSEYNIQTDPPMPLPDDRAHFKIFGKR